MKKTIKLTESSLIKLIKNLVNEQLTTPTTGGSSTGKPTKQNQTVPPPKESELQKLINKSFNFPFPLNLYYGETKEFVYQVEVLNLRWSGNVFKGEIKIVGDAYNRPYDKFKSGIIRIPKCGSKSFHVTIEWDDDSSMRMFAVNDKFINDFNSKICIESQYPNIPYQNQNYVPAAPGGYGSVPRKNQPNDYV